MPELRFLRQFIGGSVQVLGVAFPDDALFHLFVGSQTKITSHLKSVQEKLSKVKTRRSSPINLTQLEYDFYVQNNQLTFAGAPLIQGWCLVLILVFRITINHFFQHFEHDPVTSSCLDSFAKAFVFLFQNQTRSKST